MGKQHTFMVTDCKDYSTCGPHVRTSTNIANLAAFQAIEFVY